MSRRTEIGLINVAGLVQGLALVTFPAASSIFTSSHGFRFSASRYGMMFIPQVALAILASSFGPQLAHRWTLKRVLQAGLAADRDAGADHLPGRFWLFATAVLLYGVAETLNGNWSGPYLTRERGLSAESASFTLMAFWAMVTVGRLLFATESSERTVRWIYVGLPVVLIAAFQIVSHANGEVESIVAFGLSGLGCSAFFPLCISLSGQEFPQLTAAMSGRLVAVYQAATVSQRSASVRCMNWPVCNFPPSTRGAR
jgi:hypothetical protein